MLKDNQSPLRLLGRATILALQGRVQFPRDDFGQIVRGDDEDFEIFRKVILKTPRDKPNSPGALFIVQFRFARFSITMNRLLSLIPIPFIVAQPGFRSKTWAIGQRTGTFRGIYEWSSVEEAERYWTSFPMKLMKRRSVPQSLHHEIKKV